MPKEKSKKKLQGRPPLPPEQRRDAPVIYLRLTHMERDRVDSQAASEDMSTIEWVRDVINAQFE